MSPVDESTIESDELGELDGLDELEFLSRAAVILAEMRPDDDIFAFVGNALARLAPDSLLAVCSYEPDIESTVLRTLAGPSDMRALAEEVLGPPIGLQFRLNRCAQRMREGNLLQVEDMRQLSFETWDLELSRRLEATLGIRGIFGQAFARRGDFLGTVSIVSRRSRLEHTELIEAFINLAGVALRRLRAEAKLYESESRFRMLAENSRDVIYRLRVEPTPQFEYVSPASTQVVGLRPQELYENVELGAGCLYPKDWITTTRPRDVPEDAIVVPCKRGDGTLRWTEQKFSAVRDERGEIVAFEGIVRDVTSRKNAQDALVEADRRKDEFLAVLSHELRNPLTPIRHGLYILAHAEPGSSQANRARTIMERQVNHLSRLLDDLLDVTRIVRKKISLQLVSLDLGELVRATVDDHRPLFADRKIDVDVDVDVPSEAVMINGDVTRLAQVIGNL
ncbi:MAG TPA: histidine kinase dimerization/phospho-acceptor domain-containing protein, partial [Labilithrix sp.]|nr:histidine kinase dimerization/phospho-acceptor domain-containing protein [Labilithrix sp.]